MTGELAAFLGVAAVVICTPGQDTALTIRNTLAGGRRGGVATAAGVALGQAGWTLATFTWLALYAFAVSRVRRVLLRDRVRRLVDAVTGAVLVAFGLRLAATRG